MAVQQILESAKVLTLPIQRISVEKISTEEKLNLLELKDVCKYYFEGIKEESAYESATPERLGKIASLALEIIDHFEKYGN